MASHKGSGGFDESHFLGIAHRTSGASESEEG
jgi:hypothetical protein